MTSFGGEEVALIRGGGWVGELDGAEATEGAGGVVVALRVEEGH